MKTFKQIRKVLIEVDPSRLIEKGAPIDEYDEEARIIDRFLVLGGNLTETVIQQIFEGEGLPVSSTTVDVLYRRLI